MKNVLHKNKWNVGVVQLHVETPPIILIKSKHNDKSDKDFVNIKFRMDPMSENSDLYKFKTSLFNNGELEEFCCSFLTPT